MFTKLTGWNDGINWTDDVLDPSNHKFIQAIHYAILERMLATQSAINGLGYLSAYSGLTMFPKKLGTVTVAQPVEYMPFSVDTATWIASAIISLTTKYYILNPDSEARITTPYITVWQYVMSTSMSLSDLYIYPGEMLSCIRVSRFLKLCKTLLDLCLITELPQPNIIGDYYYGYQSSANSWEEAWLLMQASLVKTESDVEIERTMAFVKNTTLRFYNNIRYTPKSDLAHHLIFRDFGTYYNESTTKYYKQWDYFDNGITSANLTTFFISKEAGVVTLFNDPPQTPVFFPWDEESDIPEYNGNTYYTYNVDKIYADFGVSDGFTFRP